ncbi:MAG: DJ-1/PfpI family protein [Methanotrichaceae archaeon]
MNKAEEYVCAICTAPSILIKGRVLEGKKITVSPAGCKEMKASTGNISMKWLWLIESL